MFAAHSKMLLFLLFLLEQLEGVVIVLMLSYAQKTSERLAGTDVHEDFVIAAYVTQLLAYRNFMIPSVLYEIF